MLKLFNKSLTILLALSATAFAQHELWYPQPAEDWNQALPIGNGRLGAMVFGETGHEQIQLNEDSMWPTGATGRNVKGTPADLAKARKLIAEGKLKKASEFIPNTFSVGNIDLTWKNGKLTQATITSGKGTRPPS